MTSSPSKTRGEDERKCQDSWGDVEGVDGLELRDHSASDFMVQPGRVIHLEHVRSNAPTATPDRAFDTHAGVYGHCRKCKLVVGIKDPTTVTY